MIDKQQRHDVISRLVAAGAVATQGQMLDALATHGVGVDQSTLSRDLQELRIRKVSGRYSAEASENGFPSTVGGQHATANYLAGVSRFTVCGPHQIIVFTEVGLAQSVAVAIEQMGDPSILATLAGDDVIFLATKTRSTQSVALRRLKQWMGDHKYEQ